MLLEYMATWIQYRRTIEIIIDSVKMLAYNKLKGDFNMFKFQVGQLVKYNPLFCSEGEEKYVHRIIERRYSPITAKPTRYLIKTLNTSLTLPPIEEVEDYMIEPIKEGNK